MFIDQLEPADRRNISLLLDGVMSNRDPRTKTGPSRTRTEKFRKSQTNSDRSVHGSGGPWIPYVKGNGSAFLTSSIFPFQLMTRFQNDFRHNFDTLDFENIHPKMAVTRK